MLTCSKCSYYIILLGWYWVAYRKRICATCRHKCRHIVGVLDEAVTLTCDPYMPSSGYVEHTDADCFYFVFYYRSHTETRWWYSGRARTSCRRAVCHLQPSGCRNELRTLDRWSCIVRRTTGILMARLQRRTAHQLAGLYSLADMQFDVVLVLTTLMDILATDCNRLTCGTELGRTKYSIKLRYGTFSVQNTGTTKLSCRRETGRRCASFGNVLTHKTTNE